MSTADAWRRVGRAWQWCVAMWVLIGLVVLTHWWLLGVVALACGVVFLIQAGRAAWAVWRVS